MPFLSVIIPVYQVQAYLDECLESVLGQDFDDFEVIAVDDASPDHSGEILDYHEKVDSRISVLHLERNVGLGPARNIGLTAASGEYVQFLDSDDTLTPGALRRIASKLIDSDLPEILLLDHARTYWTGAVKRNLRHEVLERLSGQTFVAENHPEVFQLLQAAWNKVCRRDFLLRQELSFPQGYYEDTLWTYQSIMTAESIATLPGVSVNYRQRRHGSILGTGSRRHFEAFDQWERVFQFLDSRPDLTHWRLLVSERMAGHYLTVLRKGNRILEEDRSDFFRRASQHLRTYGLPDSRSASNWTDALLHRLLYRGDERLFEALRVASKARQWGKRASRRTIRFATQGQNLSRLTANDLIYRVLRRRPLDPDLVVYASRWNAGTGGNPRAIYDAMREHAPHMHGVWIVRASMAGSQPEGMDVVVPGTRRYWHVMARATHFVTDVCLPATSVKRSGQIHLHTPQGTPLRHVGIDVMAHPLACQGINLAQLLHCSDRWDFSVSSNVYSTITLERSFPSEYTTLESGFPRNDALVQAGPGAVNAARAALGLETDERAVLYAPTHRGYDPDFLSRVDVHQISSTLGGNTVLLVLADDLDVPPARDERKQPRRVLHFAPDSDVVQLMLAADLLITDYSAIMFDYANLGRPIVIYAPDWKPFQDTYGTYLDVLSNPPGEVATTHSQLTDILSDRRWERPEANGRLANFRGRFCEFDDGHAGERLVRRIFLGEALPPSPMRW